MRTSDFDEVARLMYIRSQISTELTKIEADAERLCSVSAISFGTLEMKPTRLKSSDITVDIEKLLIDLDETDALFLNGVRQALMEYLSTTLKLVDQSLTELGVNLDFN
jgi:hypothetical protein